MLRIATEKDFGKLCALYQAVCESMNREGLNQWAWGRYPTEEKLMRDVQAKRMYVYEENETFLAAVVLEDMLEDEYLPVNWLFGIHPGVFHRFAVNSECQGRGIGKKLWSEMEQVLISLGCDSMRFDTEWDNVRAISLYDKMSARRSGIIHWDGDDIDYICFEKPLTPSCPLLPLKMTPAFRGGSLTPWGGEKLRSVFGKNIKDVPTGESLEVSCIPGLESTDCMGVRLPDIIAKFGENFAGKYSQGQFPLLLKIIDAADSLSVQVHPDNDYASRVENGKLGKTEAWLILDAPAGSQLVYGIAPGITKDSLEAACENGSAVEPLLRRVDVKPGDVCFIPAGCVHAIGQGIMLYEIQQSSDITYRFYDWNRVDKNGNKRPLHIKKAIDVTDISFALSPVSCGNAAGCSCVLDEKYFSLDIYNVSGNCPLKAVQDFGMLTALTSPMTLSWSGGSIDIAKGETVFIPAKSPEITICGNGRAAVSMPK